MKLSHSPAVLVLEFLLLTGGAAAHAAGGACQGKVLNPVTDICWQCLFPVKIGGASFGRSGEPAPGTITSPVCACPDSFKTPILVKSNYRLQIARPVRGNDCIPIGRPSLLWGAAKNPPFGTGSTSADNFLWSLTRRRVCCVGYSLN